MSNGMPRPPWLAWVLLLFPLWFLFYRLSAFGLFNNVEGMCAEIARAMLESRDLKHWIIPYLNDVPYIEKPPLLYWLAALSMAMFGTTDWAVRLVPIASGLFLLGVVGWFGRRERGARYALLSVFVLGSTAGFVVMSRDARPDALLSAFLNAALLLTYAGLVQRRKAALRAAAICLALAVLSKGFVALALYGLAGVGYLVWCRRADWAGVLKQLCEPGAVALFLLVAAPWHIAAVLALPEFGWFYFVNEHVYRFLGIREPHDYFRGSVFYYLPRLAAMFLPWLLLAVPPLWMQRRAAISDRELRNFLWCAVLGPLLFFSLSSAKANYYAVVCLPGLALLAALSLDRLFEARDERFARRVWIALFVVGIALVPIEEAVMRYGAKLESDFSARPLAAEIQARAAAGEHLPVYLYQDYEDYSTLPFYLRSNVGIVDQRSEDLRFGIGLGAGTEHFVGVEQFLTRLAHDGPAWLVVLDARQRAPLPEALKKRLTLMRKVGRATLYRAA